MKKLMIVTFCLCFAIVTGCSTKTYPKVELDPGKGEVKSITLDAAIEKKNNNENFLLIITQTYCGFCMDFFMESDSYTQEAGITLWCITLDKEDRSEEQNLSLVHDNFGDFSTTPSLYFIGDGKTQNTLLSSEKQVNLESYQNWLKECQIITSE